MCSFDNMASLNKEGVSPDWSRESIGFFEWAPDRRLIQTIRRYQRTNRMNVLFRVVCRRCIKISHAFWSVITGTNIPLTAQIGGGLQIPHPNGIVIHPRAKVGVNCTIFQQVTLGGRDDKHGAPVIGNHVIIGAGAKILGDVIVGDHAKIGANAVVLRDVPSRASAVGVPARIIQDVPQSAISAVNK